MTQPHELSSTPAQPQLPELMARYLERQTAAQAAGLVAAEQAGEVVPFEAAPTQPVDPRLAWDEATAALDHYAAERLQASWQAPADWSGTVTGHEPVMALAFCVGNFPQLLRHLQSLLHTADLTLLRPRAGRQTSMPALEEWAHRATEKPHGAQALVAVGVLRLAKQYDQAALVLRQLRADAPTSWRPALANEEAALAWHQGRAEEAIAVWESQSETVPVLFNRGMAALFMNRPVEARTWLGQAVTQLPDDSAWHHLGRLYLALAEMRS